MSRPLVRKERPIRTVFLDRDGVINRKMPDGQYVERWEEFEFLPGSIEALRSLRAAGVRLVVVTNQRGIAKGAISPAALDDIHRRMRHWLSEHGAHLDAILVCPHEEGACECRKPALGLFNQGKSIWPEIEFTCSAVIGDSWRDMSAAFALGSWAFLIGDAASLDRATARYIDGFGSSLLEVVERFVIPAASSDVDQQTPDQELRA